MPKIQWERLPREKWAHLRDRAKERQISEEDLFELAEWKAQDPDVPDGDWFKDFGTFKICGTGRHPSTFLLAGQAARGKRLYRLAGYRGGLGKYASPKLTCSARGFVACPLKCPQKNAGPERGGEKKTPPRGGTNLPPHISPL